MTDLKLIDELLVCIKVLRGLTWPQLETYSHATDAAMTRLRQAFESGEMSNVTLGLAKHFRGERAER